MSITPRIDKIQKNYIINGDMSVAQRNTSFVSPANGAYLTDRFKYNNTGGSLHTVTQDTDVPTFVQAGYLFQNSLRLNLTTADTSIAAGETMRIDQWVEGYNWAQLAQKSFTISFWVKATLAGVYCVSFRNTGLDRSYVAEYTINATNTWEKKTIVVAASPATGGWNYTNGSGLMIGFALSIGSTFQTSPNAWQTGNFMATSNQVNGTNTGATDFRITGVCLYEGALESPEFGLFGKDSGSDFGACQRYYEKGTTAITGASAGIGNAYGVTRVYSTPKRATPTVALSNFVNSAGASAQNATFSNIDGYRHNFVTSVAAGGNVDARGDFTADAEL